MGEISITIHLAYIYIPLIFFVSYFLLKLMVCEIVLLYLKNKYKKRVRPEVIKIIYESIIHIENERAKDSSLVFNEMKIMTDSVNDRMSSFLTKRMKFGARFDCGYDGGMDGSYIEKIELAIRLVFPYWKTVIFYKPKEDIWIHIEDIKKEYRENAINCILND